jgi:hypothetical protein
VRRCALRDLPGGKLAGRSGHFFRPVISATAKMSSTITTIAVIVPVLLQPGQPPLPRADQDAETLGTCAAQLGAAVVHQESENPLEGLHSEPVACGDLSSTGTGTSRLKHGRSGLARSKSRAGVS